MTVDFSNDIEEQEKKQTVFRLSRTKGNYKEIINKGSLRDKRLSFKAKGLHQYMLSMSDHWVFYRDELLKHCTDRKDSLRTAMKELIALGYASNKSVRCPKGRHLVWETKVYEVPELNNDFNNSVTTGDKSNSGKRLKKSKILERDIIEDGEAKNGKSENGDEPTLFWYS